MRYWLACAALALVCVNARAAMLHETFDNPPSSAISATGLIGAKSAGFNGREYAVLAQNSSILKGVEGATLSAWINFDTTRSTQNSIVAVGRHTDTGANLFRAELKLESTTGQYVLMARGYKDDADTSRPTVSINITSKFATEWIDHWRHVAAQFDYAGNKIWLFVDGQPTTASPVSVSPWGPSGSKKTSNTTSAMITAGTGTVITELPSNPFYGQIDDVSIYDSLLGATHIRALYELGISTFGYNAADCAGLVDSHAAGEDWTNGTDIWNYVELLPGPAGAAGTLYEFEGQTYLRLSTTTGMVHTPEPHVALILGFPALLMCRRRRQRA